MMQANTETALLLEQHANEISLAASRHLLSTAPDIVAKFGGDVNKVWQQHFDQRILEL